MDTKIIGGIIAAVVIIAVIAGVLLMQQGQQTQQTTPTTTTPPSVKTTTTTTPTRTTTTTQPTNTTTTTQVITPKIEASVQLKAVNPTPEEQQEGIVLKIDVNIEITTDRDYVLVKEIYFDNIKPGSGNPLIEDLYLHYDPPKKTPISESFTVYLTQDLPQDLIDQWRSGTNHTLTVVYIYNDQTFTETFNVTVQ